MTAGPRKVREGTLPQDTGRTNTDLLKDEVRRYRAESGTNLPMLACAQGDYYNLRMNFSLWEGEHISPDSHPGPGVLCVFAGPAGTDEDDK